MASLRLHEEGSDTRHGVCVNCLPLAEVSEVDLTTHLPHTQRLWLPSPELRGSECDGKIPSLDVHKEEENVLF